MTKPQYSYTASVKSSISDELINTYCIRPLAGIFVRLVFPTPVTPNHITIASTLVGFLAASFYLDGTAAHNILAGLCITLKDILDSADGQLARAKQQYSRIGRFLDSIGDFCVNFFAFAAIAAALFQSSHSLSIIVLCLLGFIGTTLRVSYHVFYHASYLHLEKTYTVNRVTEEIREEDLREDRRTLRLQCLFQFLYGWQDRMIVKIDEWCHRGVTRNESNDKAWYGDPMSLRISALLGLGTELFVLMLFSVSHQLERYLYVNLFVMNGVWLASLGYRRLVLRRSLTRTSSSARS